MLGHVAEGRREVGSQAWRALSRWATTRAAAATSSAMAGQGLRWGMRSVKRQACKGQKWVQKVRWYWAEGRREATNQSRG